MRTCAGTAGTCLGGALEGACGRAYAAQVGRVMQGRQLGGILDRALDVCVDQACAGDALAVHDPVPDARHLALNVLGDRLSQVLNDDLQRCGVVPCLGLRTGEGLRSAWHSVGLCLQPLLLRALTVRFRPSWSLATNWELAGSPMRSTRPLATPDRAAAARAKSWYLRLLLPELSTRMDAITPAGRWHCLQTPDNCRVRQLASAGGLE